MAAKKARAMTREHAERAISQAARGWIGLSFDGDPLAKAVANILVALNTAARASDVDALTAKPGPDRWATTYQLKAPHSPKVWSTLNPEPRAATAFRSRAAEARSFVGSVAHYVEQWQGESHDPLKPFRTETGARAFAEYMAVFFRMSGVKNGLVPPEAKPLADLYRSMTRNVLHAAKREDTLRPGRAPKAFAEALMRGWGASEADIAAAMKNVKNTKGAEK